MSTTQQYSTTTSMGRLMINILLSLAQFEREVTGKRIRDKIAASKAKGMWMGGAVPLGCRVEAGPLIAEPAEAEWVRRILARLAQCRSTTELVRWLNNQEGQASWERCSVGWMSDSRFDAVPVPGVDGEPPRASY